jgi:hypothetical protein
MSRLVCNATKAVTPDAKMTSGESATSSAAALRAPSTLPVSQRISNRILRPSVQPNSCIPCKKALVRACVSGSPRDVVMSTPMRRTRSCARAARGQATKAPPSLLMNSRRFTATPEEDTTSYGSGRWIGRRPHRCPLWVKSRHSQCTSLCPLYPNSGTFAAHKPMSALCQ